mgnify:CR=1 FL=1
MAGQIPVMPQKALRQGLGNVVTTAPIPLMEPIHVPHAC